MGHAEVIEVADLPLECGTTLTISSVALSGAAVAAESITIEVPVVCAPTEAGTLGLLAPATSVDGASTWCVAAGAEVRATWDWGDSTDSVSEYLVATYAADASPTEDDWSSVGPSRLYWADLTEAGDAGFSIAVRPCGGPGLCADPGAATTAFVQVRPSRPPSAPSTSFSTAAGTSRRRWALRTWSGFTGAAKIEMCVGTTPTGCRRRRSGGRPAAGPTPTSAVP